MMKKLTGSNRRLALVLALLPGLSFVPVASAGQDKPDGMAAAKQATIVYSPPLRGAPLARVGGSTRDIDGRAAVLQVLAPDHTGLTTQAQPTIYWYARTPAAARFEFTLIDGEGIDPLLEVEADSDRVSGYRQLNLGEYGITLQPGVSYPWSVALVSDAASRPSHLISSGIIEYVEPGADLSSRIDNATGSDLVGVYASEGIWYDALDTISRLIDESPADQGLVAIRDALLVQVGLQAVTGR